ncbi:uncharacterized protein LOC123225648 [Mangifera indica]|uniref:uncharacterized protein LOC123225648 n=1 Tax=Mangifera indica TaxID=29780 RepID=UPI001CFA9B0A|nr:uncharacterized protein LOC123225648 [Mangifera indica]
MAKKDISRKRRRIESELRIPDESRHFRADAISRAQRTALSRISSTLTPQQLRPFERTCFGSFLRLPETKFCGILVHAFLLRQLHPPFARDEFWFRVSGVDVSHYYDTHGTSNAAHSFFHTPTVYSVVVASDETVASLFSDDNPHACTIM